MKLKVKFRGIIEKGEGSRKRIKIANEKYYHYLVSKFELKDEVWLTVENKRSHRSLKQNNLYWVYLTAISEHTGHTEEELHEYCKINFLSKRQIILKGKQYALTGSTTKLSKGEFVEFVMKVQAFASSLGIVLPDPKDFELSTLQN